MNIYRKEKKMSVIITIIVSLYSFIMTTWLCMKSKGKKFKFVIKTENQQNNKTD